MPKPSIGDVKVVTPMHIVNAEYMFVQYNEWFERFQEFHATVQSFQPKHLSYIPSE